MKPLEISKFRWIGNETATSRMDKFIRRITREKTIKHSETIAIAERIARKLIFTEQGVRNSLRAFTHPFYLAGDEILKGENISLYERYTKTDEERKKARIEFELKTAYAQCSWLKKCDLCMKLGSPLNIKYRANLYGWAKPEKNDKCTMCMSCWNKVRAVLKHESDALETKRIIYQLNKEIRNERKNKNNRTNA